jgi:hypothetical protein
MQGRVSGRLDSEITAGIGRAGDGDDDSLSLVLPARRTGPKVVVGLLILGLMGAAGYYSYHGGFGSHRGSEAVASTPSPAPVAPRALPASPPAAAPVAAAAPVPTPPPAPTAPAAAVAPPAAAPAPSPPPAPAPTAAAVPAPAPAASPAAEEASASSVGASGRRGPVHAAGPGAAEISGRGHSYEQLVADGDRALENGNTAKAQKMFDEALRLQPDGVAAVTGSGYLLLDRQKPLAAIGMFKRALASAPSFPQALFGLGEAYRSQGNPGEAIDAYRKYLSVAPGGPDAPAARRQVRELESAAAPARHAVTSPPEGAAPLPIAPPPN